MSNDPATNDFIRACVMQAARFYNMGEHEAAGAITDVARMAVESPQPTAPIHHYVGNLRRALFDGYGEAWELADLAHIKQEEAISAWGWFIDATGADPDAATSGKGITRAVSVMRGGGAGWRQRMRAILQNHRAQFGANA